MNQGVQVKVLMAGFCGTLYHSLAFPLDSSLAEKTGIVPCHDLGQRQSAVVSSTKSQLK